MLADPAGIPALSAEESDVLWPLREHVEQLRHPLPGQRKRHMKDEEKVVASFQKAMKTVLARLPPEEVLDAVAPEQRLAGRAEAKVLLALPESGASRAVGRVHVATLPRSTGGHPAAPRASPARPPVAHRAVRPGAASRDRST